MTLSNPILSNPILGTPIFANPVLHTIHARKHVGALMLRAPGPDAAQLEAILNAALAAPDHGKIVPYRLVVVPDAERTAFTTLSLAAFREAIPDADESGLKKARGKADQPPMIIALIACFQPDHPKIGLPDQWLTLGCVLQNLWLAAESLGFGCGVSSGRLLETAAMRHGFQLGAHEQLVSIIAMGTPSERQPPRIKPSIASVVSMFSS